MSKLMTVEFPQASPAEAFSLGLPTRSMMDPIKISIVALVVSLVSLGFSAYFGLRDRASLRTKSSFTEGWEGGAPSVVSTIVNAGRRPVVIRMWAGAESDKNWVGTYIGVEERGLRLGEHERYDLRLHRQDLYATTPDDEFWIKDLWFEDTLGRRHKVKDAKANIAKLRASDADRTTLIT
ncbi:hypothetical protein ACSFA8_24635 [Variovorax sp. RT4R15]|uniref:hypothetical protein n=1 Tax=Variovorax sp. RT4R15 TaxID=3443737 RepID=UPI003F475367